MSFTRLTASPSKLTARRGLHSLTSCRLVLETLTPLPDDRTCFRMINGVLVERTVKDVVPALKTNAEGLKKVLDDLVKQYKTKQDDLEKWKKKNNVQVVQS
ncbi:Prefoldin beta-like protein [Xylariaceae sp. FL1272]|nr:Prefoldin beta-like protein [Xylariaceae sp. FL1272]